MHQWCIIYLFKEFVIATGFKLCCSWLDVADCGNEHADMLDSIEATRIKPKDDSSGGISLPPFGMANYKLQGDLWVKPETSDLERIIYLRSAADSWLKQLDVYHHDYNFFTSHSTV